MCFGQALRILIVDDQERIGRSVRSLLQTQLNWVVCGEASTGRQGVKQAMELHPDVILVDITMPEMDGLAATRQITAEDPGSHVIILTHHESESVTNEAFRAGARSYVLKSRPQDIVPAIQAICS